MSSLNVQENGLGNVERRGLHVVDYVLVSRKVNVHRMVIEDEGAVELDQRTT